MAIQATTAAKALENSQDEISSHQLISLLMDGGLERISQAKTSISHGNQEDADVLLQKIVGIINGLRSSLNFEDGGEIATNLDSLYDYMLDRIDSAPLDDKLKAVSEVGELLTEVKVGWDQMDTDSALIEK
ncbi:flagellar export chaperone FliS [Agarilytica rhodophyticola]|uniref:flagellar export chaperone FliS n=1 Tax=Agarilytica rhodophyticola TaxID=1737490 RepID=UPI000B344607|nr:flagellar export chaperone FliS [Agarilytica rhodophyticola]